MKKRALFLSVIFFCATVSCAEDIFYLSLSAHGQRVDLGIAGFAPSGEQVEESKIGRQITSVLRNDLLFARYFNIIESGPLYLGKDSDLEEWKKRGANILLSGRIKIKNSSLIVVSQLIDIYSNSVIWEKVYKGSSDAYRGLAHEINDDIIFRFTGERGIAHSKIVFTNNGSGFKEMYIMDYDGYNIRQLTHDRTINLLPKWSPDAKEVIYTSYKYANPDLFSFDIQSGKKRVVSKMQGLNTAGSFSPDGSRIALTLSKNNLPNIYIITREGEVLQQLTFGRSIATSPYFSPNNKEIAYISDLPGYPQVYIMDLDTRRTRRLYTKGFCDSPVWSPRGDKIAFSMRVQGYGYEIFIYDLNTSDVRRLTHSAGNDENPSFSPDGRFIVFSSSHLSKSTICMIALDGSGLRELTDIPGVSYTPSWSP